MSVDGKNLNAEDFETHWKAFLELFNSEFDTPENLKQISDAGYNAFLEDTDTDMSISECTEHIYQTERTNNLVKAAIAYFLDIH